ncbi:MAG: hypothetical protein Q9N34_01410 [Aquificota bacterium]|nr:hypothetical protein [Aquificota bacterium]
MRAESSFKQNCASCHSLRYDGIYLMSVTAKPEWSKIEKSMGKPILEEKDGELKVRGYFVPKDVYESVAFADLQALKASFGKIPPDLSTMYLSRGAGYLLQLYIRSSEGSPGNLNAQALLPRVRQGRLPRR